MPKQALKKRAVRGSRTGRPIMVVLDLLGRRGALRILWELRAGPLTFRALQAASESNPSLVNTRLAELRAARVRYVLSRTTFRLPEASRSPNSTARSPSEPPRSSRFRRW